MNGITRQLGTVAEISILDQDPRRAERQRVDKAIAIALRHRRIHDNRPGQPMRRRQFDFLPEELLPPQIERLRWPLPAPVDHRPRCQHALVGQRHTRRRQRHHRQPGQHRPGR